MYSVELVGIVNVTPDSFSDGGKYSAADRAIKHTHQLFKDGASFVDIGGESTRPDATPISHDEEWRRIAPVLAQLISQYPGQISIDTYHPETVRKAARYGRFIINDVTTFCNPQMREAAAELGLTCIVSHMPEQYGQDIRGAHTADSKISSIAQVEEELMTRVFKLSSYGIREDQIILDPGIGFGKTHQLNWQLLEFARLVPKFDVMVGYSN